MVAAAELARESAPGVVRSPQIAFEAVSVNAQMGEVRHETRFGRNTRTIVLASTVAQDSRSRNRPGFQGPGALRAHARGTSSRAAARSRSRSSTLMSSAPPWSNERSGAGRGPQVVYYYYYDPQPVSPMRAPCRLRATTRTPRSKSGARCSCDAHGPTRRRRSASPVTGGRRGPRSSPATVPRTI